MKLVVRNTGFYVAARVAAAVIGILATALFSRLIAPAAYGDFAVAMSVALLVESIFFSWIGLSILRLLPAQADAGRPFLAGVVALYLIACAVIFAVAVVVSLSGVRTSPFLILSAVAIGAVQGWLGITLQFFTAQLNPQAFSKTILVRAAAMLALGGTLAALRPDAASLITAVLLSCAVALVVARRESAVLLARPRWRPDAARAVCAYGMPLAGTLGLMWILDASDRLLLYAFLGPEAAGRYAVAYDIAARPIAMTMAGVAFAVLPLLSRAYEEGGAGGARTLFGFAAIILLAIGLPVTVLEAALARDISQVVLGAQYAGAAAEIIPIIAVASFLSGVRLYYLDYNHHLSKRTMTLAIEWAAAAVANVLLNLLLIPRFGAPGAAYATLLAYALLHLTYLVSRDRNIPLAFPMREIAKVALAAATMTIPLSMDLAGPPWLRLLLTGSAAASLYVVVLYASNLAGLRTWVNTRITAMTVSA